MKSNGLRSPSKPKDYDSPDKLIHQLKLIMINYAPGSFRYYLS